ncbi:MAG: hypothetical protein IKP28_00775 [Clostridia bacterium]|nr:hypothetical protein [Clostridia bacterium]
MKKILLGLLIVVVITLGVSTVFAANEVEPANTNNGEKNIVGEVAKMKEKAQNELNDYTERYGSESYGLTAYILKKIQVYSIPFCFLGVALSAIYQYVLGIRRLDTRDKGFYSLVGFVTIFIICQVLPLVFAIVIKGWRD